MELVKVRFKHEAVSKPLLVRVAGSGAKQMALEFDVRPRGAIRFAADPATQRSQSTTKFCKLLSPQGVV